MSIIGFVDSIGRDLRYALRGLARRPTFTFAAVVTLAVGISATTAIFRVVYSVLIAAAVSGPGRAHADQTYRHSRRQSARRFSTLHETRTTFADIGVWRRVPRR
jgi:hypothetical protein